MDHRSLTSKMALMGAALLASACMEIGEGTGSEADFETSDGQRVSGAMIIRWNQISTTTLSPTNPADAARGYAMVHLAMHDAVNGATRRYEAYLSTAKDRSADPQVAAAQAAHDVLVALRPAKQSSLDQSLAADLAAATNARARDRGVALGKAAAQAMVAARANDGSSTVVPYSPGTGPGKYQYTPPFNFVILTNYQFVTPFVLDSPDQFRPGPPPALDSDEWAADYNEVQAYGSASSTLRTADQTNAARFWIDSATFAWNRIAITMANSAGTDLWDTARAFALMNTALVDAAIMVVDSKYTYDFWRPITAIRAGDTDSREDTVADTAWTSLIGAPPFPEYVSGHTALSQASAEVLAALYGEDTGFTLTSPTTVPANGSRVYTSFDHAADEVVEARIWGGIHYRTADEVGQELGGVVGQVVLDSILADVCDNPDPGDDCP